MLKLTLPTLKVDLVLLSYYRVLGLEKFLH